LISFLRQLKLGYESRALGHSFVHSIALAGMNDIRAAAMKEKELVGSTNLFRIYSETYTL
jgi:hypothetical protein